MPGPSFCCWIEFFERSVSQAFLLLFLDVEFRLERFPLHRAQRVCECVGERGTASAGESDTIHRDFFSTCGQSLAGNRDDN